MTGPAPGRWLGALAIVLMTGGLAPVSGADPADSGPAQIILERPAIPGARPRAACGPFFVLLARRLPPPGIPSVWREDAVLEFDTGYAVARQWSIPVTAWVEAIQGSELLVPHPAGPREPVELSPRVYNAWLAVRPDGSFRIVPRATRVPAPRPGRCAPEGTPCWLYEDLATGEPRWLAYRGPCR